MAGQARRRSVWIAQPRNKCRSGGQSAVSGERALRQRAGEREERARPSKQLVPLALCTLSLVARRSSLFDALLSHMHVWQWARAGHEAAAAAAAALVLLLLRSRSADARARPKWQPVCGKS